MVVAGNESYILCFLGNRFEAHLEELKSLVTDENLNLVIHRGLEDRSFPAVTGIFSSTHRNMFKAQ
jgi:hypothetical protein